MEVKRHHYWDELNRYLTFALHELLNLPMCCAHCMTAGNQIKKDLGKVQRRLAKTAAQCAEEELELDEFGDSVCPLLQGHISKIHAPDILNHAHSCEAQRYAKESNASFQNWLTNDFDRMDPIQALPHPSGYEQNVTGFNEQHLQRVEQYWIDHQLRNPSCSTQAKSCPLATAADWARTRLAAEEAGHKMAETV